MPARASPLSRAWPVVGAVLLGVASFHWLLRGQVQAARDLYAQFFPETHYLIERWRAFEVPVWLPHERLGQPFLALLYTQVFYAPRVLTGLAFGHVVGPNVLHVFNCGWAFTGAFLGLRRAGCSRSAAFVGSAGWAFSPFFVELSQNLAFASTAAWAGWAFWATLGLERAPSLRRLAWCALVLAAAFHAGAPEMWLWQVLLVVALAIASRRRGRALSLVALGGLWAALGFAVVALPAAELAFAWTDPTAPAGGLLEWSMSWQQLVSVVVPDADFPRAEPFFGADQRFFFTLLLGPVVVLLAAVGATSRRARPFVALALVCGVLALGMHFLPARLVLQLPPFRFFRFPAKYAVGLLFGLSMLAAFGLDRLGALVRHRRGSLAPACAGAVGLALGLALAARALDDVREGLVRGSAWLVVSTLVLIVVARHRQRRWLVPIWLTMELLVIPRREWPPAPTERFLAPSPIAETIRAEPHGRVSIRVDMDDPGTPWCSTPDDEAEADTVVLDSRRRLSVLRYLEEDLRSTSGYGFRDPWRLARAFQQGRAAFQLAGVTHFVRNAGEPLRFDGPVPSRTAIDDLWLWRAPDAMPRGWMVHRVTVATDDEAFAELGRQARAPRDFAVVDRAVTSSDAPPGCTSTVATTEQRPEVVVQDVSACAAGLVVLGDAWFPGWQADVDGVEAEPVRVWGFLRGVAVPPGAHRVTWRYQPWTLRLGASLSAASWLLMVLGLLIRRPTP
ncbi:MAG: hypothetical protein JNJ54_34430 [Myxococcaceae bacterium]|nr:hypothetical protein [Myxococcaceae bacterium]